MSEHNNDGKRRGFIAAGKIGEMASGTIFLVRCAAGRRYGRARDLVSARRVGRIHRRDLVGMDAQPSLKAGAPAALERAREGLRLAQMEPGTVDRILESRGSSIATRPDAAS